MPRESKPPRLWKRAARRDKDGRITRPAAWIVLDGGKQFGTGIEPDDRKGAEQALADYIARRHTKALANGRRSEDVILITDVLNVYVNQVVIGEGRNPQSLYRIPRLAKFFAGKALADLNGQLCREYAEKSSTPSMARHDLEDLRAAINHHHTEGLHKSLIKVWMPDKDQPRERWLTKVEVARMIHAAYRFRHGRNHTRSRLHIARFILIGVYTGSRPRVIAEAALQKEPGRPYFDLERGLFYRRPERSKETKKRRPPIPVPPRLLAHLRRWKALGCRYACEWRGRPATDTKESFRRLVADLELGDDVVRHTLRHTCATWLMQGGADPWRAAGFLGMTVATLERTYGHHHPNFLSGVHEAFRRA